MLYFYLFGDYILSSFLFKSGLHISNFMGFCNHIVCSYPRDKGDILLRGHWANITVNNYNLFDRFRIKTVKTLKLCRYDFLIICASGLVRGSVAFALVMYLIQQDRDHGVNQQRVDRELSVITTGIIFLIFGTNLVIGVLMPFLAGYSFKKMQTIGVDEMMINKKLEKIGRLKTKNLNKKLKSDRKTQRFKVFFKRFDDDYIKPFLIFNFKLRQEEIRKQKALKEANESKKQIRRSNSDEHIGHTKTMPIERMATRKLEKPVRNSQTLDEPRTDRSNLSLDISSVSSHDSRLSMIIEMKKLDISNEEL